MASTAYKIVNSELVCVATPDTGVQFPTSVQWWPHPHKAPLRNEIQATDERQNELVIK